MGNNLINNIVFAGTPEISGQLLQDLIDQGYNITACYTQPDRPKGRKQLITYSPVKQIALKHNITVIQPNSLKERHVIEELKSLNPDLMIVFAYGLILPPAILTIPKLGCLNVHTSLLPKWRGAAPVQHAILSGDQVTGISIIQMDEGLDTGNVVYTLQCNITQDDTAASLYVKLQPLATDAIVKVLEQLKHSNILSLAQDHKLATYAHKLNKGDAKINWEKPAIEIERLVRALIPQPIAFTGLNNHEITIRIWQAKILNDFDVQELIATITNADLDLFEHINSNQKQLISGTIVRVNKLGIDVITGKNGIIINKDLTRIQEINSDLSTKILRIEKLQLPGSKILTVAEILNAPKYQALFMVGNKFN